LERLRDDTGVVARDVEAITNRESRIEAAPAVKAILAHEHHRGARGFRSGATDECIEDLAERSGTAECADPFRDPPGGCVAFGGHPLGAIDGRSIGFGASDSCLLRLGASHRCLLGFGAGDVCFGANSADFGANTVDFGANSVDFGASGVGFGASGVDFGASGVGFGAGGVGLGASGVGFGASDGRQFVADDANLPRHLVADLPGDLVAKTVGKCIQSALELFVKGQS
jgi:hypothetical protein